MKTLLFSFSVFLYTIITSPISAAIVRGSLWISPNKQQTIVLLGDQHRPTSKTNTTNWYTDEVNQFQLFINAIKNLKEQKSIEILTENIATRKNQGHALFESNNKLGQFLKISQGKTLKEFILKLKDKIKENYLADFLSLIDLSLEEYPYLYKNIFIQDLEIQKIRPQWMNILEETTHDIMDLTNQNKDIDPAIGRDLIMGEFNAFIDTVQPLFENIESVLEKYLNKTKNNGAKEILNDQLNELIEIWNKIITDNNNAEESDQALNSIMSLFFNNEMGSFKLSSYYEEQCKLAGWATPFDGICEATALFRITKNNPSNKIIISMGTAHVERLEQFLTKLKYSNLNTYAKTFDETINDHLHIPAKTIYQWITVSPEEAQALFVNRKYRKRKRKN